MISTIGMLFGMACLAAGVVVLLLAVRTRGAATDAHGYLQELEGDVGPTDQFQRRLSDPFLARVVKPLGGDLLRAVAGLTPRQHLDRVHRRLVLAGISSTITAEEFVTGQALAGGFGLLLAVGWALLNHPASRIGVLGLLLLPTIGLLAPTAWLSRKVGERQDAIRKELPDVLDLLAISVEAGLGLEGAMEVVCRHFESPLAVELSRTLREMELGLPRREALQNLKRRTEVAELSNFVLALTQADALGMPVGRVLRTQAAELRNKRRQWAREKAGKLPVKILLPLVVFIFPAILVVVLGPAASSIAKSL